MCEKCFIDGTPYQGDAAPGSTVVRVGTCPRCGGSGRFCRGTCFLCMGSGKRQQKAKVYTPESLAAYRDKIAVGKERLLKKAEQAIVDSRKAMMAEVEGFSMALIKANLMLSGAGREKSKAMQRKLEILRSAIDRRFPWTQERARLVIDLVDQLQSLGIKIDEQRSHEEDLRKDPTAWIKGGRFEIEGRVLSVTGKDSPFGYVLKVLVQDARGRKFYGTLPASIRLDLGDRGMLVKFTATVERSNDDPIFGWFKRPTKGEIIEEMPCD